MNIHNGAWNLTRLSSDPVVKDIQRQMILTMLKGEEDMVGATLASDILPEVLQKEVTDHIELNAPLGFENCSITIHSYHGLDEAMYGLMLSKGLTSDITLTEFLNDDKLYERALGVAKRLAGKGGGHDKFLESIQVWFTMDMPRYFWQEFDTYRVGGSKQSESTMYTLGKTDLSIKDFVSGYTHDEVENFKIRMRRMDRMELKKRLPEGFLQKRTLNYNLKSLLGMYQQRKTHRLLEWRVFCKVIERLMLDLLEVDIMKR